jgi:hypothetical protein
MADSFEPASLADNPERRVTGRRWSPIAHRLAARPARMFRKGGCRAIIWRTSKRSAVSDGFT